LRIGRLKLSFRTRLVLTAVILVSAIELATVVPVLSEFKRHQVLEADERLDRADFLYDEYLEHRRLQLTMALEALLHDSPFRAAVAEGDQHAVESMLHEHVRRADRASDLAAGVFDAQGRNVAGFGGGRALWPGAAMQRHAGDAVVDEAVASVEFIDGRPYHAVTVALGGSRPMAWVTLAAPIDAGFAAELGRRTTLETTIVGFDGAGKQIYASTIAGDQRAAAMRAIRLGNEADTPPGVSGNAAWITRLRPYAGEADGLYVALQLPVIEMAARFAGVRNTVGLLALGALLLSTGAAVWLSSKVTRPVQRLVAAAGRMADGIYGQAISVQSNDEFAVLAQGFNTMQEAIASREQRIVHMAHHDSLSGLPTREIVVSELRDAIDTSTRLAVVNFVLHGFDELASSLGYRIADRLVQLVAGRLRDQLQERQILGHLNRQEFVVVLPEANLEDAQAFVLAIQHLLRSGLSVGDADISLQIRAGVALCPQHGENASELLRRAGIARGPASHHLGSVGVYEPGQEEKTLERIRIVSDFPRALVSGELWVEYQPKVGCESGDLRGAEALCRWHHPRFGLLPPDEFVDAIEQAGSISQLTRWVLAEAVATLSEWRRHGVFTSMSINISANDLIDDYLPAYLDRLCFREDIQPGRITLEVTESAIMHDARRSLAVIAALREAGFRIAIDDFGTGHSALAQLKRMSVDELKIDKSFVLNIADRRDEAVVRTAIELAHQFGLTAVAEGVENEACRIRLQQLGCDVVQGFLHAKAMRAREFLAWARARPDGQGADILKLVRTGEQRRRARG